ncbi:hypothetical protein A1O3_01474 [Capronia epimyces CBS 606.96]|uniref:Aminotransferase n=1 Tax=Capronia epimyces CBS 606.96 TaxID=1182542 RepID=W9YK56_9EURO|nr:uncharacterized protein A1O3_01474 [Capronia epimyces CBS 606.96]EXJ92918.1 hypothetical protein A1O3_01474 [Capronia epimyces CBS 606.96]
MIAPTLSSIPATSAILHRSFSKEYPTAASGQGVYIQDHTGRLVLDGSSGAAVSCLGHGHKKVIEAIVEQAQQMSFAHTSFFTSDPAENLASVLISTCPDVFSKVMFVSSGSEAVESALKLARQYHLCNGQPDRHIFISRRFAYHGNTLGALSAGFNPPRRDPFQPMLSQAFRHVSPCFFTRDGLPGEDEESYVDRLVAEYETTISSLGSEKIAAIIVEPVSGATLGAVPAARGYLGRLRELCDRYGCLLIFDEVMCGMGRVGTMHAWQSLGGIAPDLQTIGKGLGAGYQPISAILIANKVHAVLERNHEQRPFVSGHTYQGHSIGCAAALATQRAIAEDKLLDNVRRMGERLSRRLKKETPMLKEVRGLGLFQAVEFATATATPPGSSIAAAVASTCLENGVAVYLCSSAVDAVLFAPPFIISESEIDKLVDVFVQSVKQTIEKAKGS